MVPAVRGKFTITFISKEISSIISLTVYSASSESCMTPSQDHTFQPNPDRDPDDVYSLDEEGSSFPLASEGAAQMERPTTTDGSQVFELADESTSSSAHQVVSRAEIDEFLSQMAGGLSSAFWKSRSSVHGNEPSDPEVEKSSANRVYSFKLLLTGKEERVPGKTPQEALPIFREAVSLSLRIARLRMAVDPLSQVKNELAVAEHAAERFTTAVKAIRCAFKQPPRQVLESFLKNVLEQIPAGTPDGLLTSSLQNATITSLLTLCDAAGVAWPDGYRADQASYGEEMATRTKPSGTVRQRALGVGGSAVEELRQRRDMTPEEIGADKEARRLARIARLKPGGTQKNDIDAGKEDHEEEMSTDQAEVSAEQSARVAHAGEHRRLKERVKSRVTPQLKEAFALSESIALPEGEALERFRASLATQFTEAPKEKNALLKALKAEMVHNALTPMVDWLKEEVAWLRLQKKTLSAQNIQCSLGDELTPAPPMARQQRAKKAYREQSLEVNGGADLIREATKALAQYLAPHLSDLEQSGLLIADDKREIMRLSSDKFEDKIKHSAQKN